jgi:sensor histidine kinase regulating citrate/malate metabolism
LENAINACENIPDSNKRFIKLRLYSKNNKLCIEVRNTYQTEPVFKDGMPVSDIQGHGFGTKSMAYIIEKYNGICKFSAENGFFIFQATA